MPSAAPRSQWQALGDLAAALGGAWPLMREVVALRHQFDQEFVVDATATTDTFDLTATPWDDVVAATVGVLPATR